MEANDLELLCSRNYELNLEVQFVHWMPFSDIARTRVDVASDDEDIQHRAGKLAKYGYEKLQGLPADFLAVVWIILEIIRMERRGCVKTPTGGRKILKAGF